MEQSFVCRRSYLLYTLAKWDSVAWPVRRSVTLQSFVPLPPTPATLAPSILNFKDIQVTVKYESLCKIDSSANNIITHAAQINPNNSFGTSFCLQCNFMRFLAHNRFDSALIYCVVMGNDFLSFR